MPTVIGATDRGAVHFLFKPMGLPPPVNEGGVPKGRPTRVVPREFHALVPEGARAFNMVMQVLDFVVLEAL
jgi:hypothetical protein